MKIKNNIEPKEIKRIKGSKELKFLKVFKRSQEAGEEKTIRHYIYHKKKKKYNHYHN